MEIPDHGDADQSIGVGLDQFFGKANGFAAKDQAIAFTELHIGMSSRGFGAEEPEPHIGMAGQEIIPVVVVGGIQVLPIIKSGAAQVVVIGLEAKGMDEMQFRVVGHAETTDAAGVLRNLGLVQNDVEQGAPDE